MVCVASKIYCFGVGDGCRDFEALVVSQGIFDVKVCLPVQGSWVSGGEKTKETNSSCVVTFLTG